MFFSDQHFVRQIAIHFFDVDADIDIATDRDHGHPTRMRDIEPYIGLDLPWCQLRLAKTCLGECPLLRVRARYPSVDNCRKQVPQQPVSGNIWGPVSGETKRIRPATLLFIEHGQCIAQGGCVLIKDSSAYDNVPRRKHQTADCNRVRCRCFSKPRSV